MIDERLQGGRLRSANRMWFMRGSVSAPATALEVRGAPPSVGAAIRRALVPVFATAVGAGASWPAVTTRRTAASATTGSRRHSVGAASRGGTRPGLLIHEPEDVATENGRPFRVFGPFQRAWLERPEREILASPDAIAGVGTIHGRRIEDLLEAIRPSADPGLLPAPGEDPARERLRSLGCVEGTRSVRD